MYMSEFIKEHGRQNTVKSYEPKSKLQTNLAVHTLSWSMKNKDEYNVDYFGYSLVLEKYITRETLFWGRCR